MTDEELIRNLRQPDINGRVGIRDAACADAIERLVQERDTAIARAEALVKERDEAQGWRWSLGEQLQKEIMLTNTLIREREDADARAEKFKAERDALRALLKEAVEVLETFGGTADIYVDDAPDSLGVKEYLRHFRRARAVLARIKSIIE